MARDLGAALLVAFAAATAACSERPQRPLEGSLAGPRSARRSPLYIYYPELDQRIVRVDLRGPSRRAFYPDLWLPDVRAVHDFAVDGRHLYALLSRRDLPDPSSLYVVDLASGAPRATIPLPAASWRLSWAAPGRLLVGHATAPSGPPGQVSLVDTERLRLVRSGALAGGCLALAGAGGRAFLIERVARWPRAAPEELSVSYQLAEIELPALKVARRLQLPAGARQVVIGPSGLLYVSHASGQGTHATDGTISVVDPRRWRLVERLRLGMVARSMIPSGRLLALSMLSSTGEAWFGAVLPDHTTLFDFRLPELVGHELAVIDDVAFFPLRSKPLLERVDLSRRRRLERLKVAGTFGYREALGALRTRPSFSRAGAVGERGGGDAR